MVAEFPDAYLRHLERLIAEAMDRVNEQREVVAQLEAKGMDATQERLLLVALMNRVQELQRDLDAAKRFAGRGGG